MPPLSFMTHYGTRRSVEFVTRLCPVQRIADEGGGDAKGNAAAGDRIAFVGF